MRLILRFLKPHWKLCVLTVFLLIADVAGALIIPTLAAQMLKEGEAGVAMQTLIYTAIAMAVAAVISGAGGCLCPFPAGRPERLCRTGRHQLFGRAEAAPFHCARS